MGIENMMLREETKKAIRVRDDFLSIASHELRTPLTSLTLQLQILQRQMQILTSENFNSINIELPSLETEIANTI